MFPTYEVHCAFSLSCLYFPSDSYQDIGFRVFNHLWFYNHSMSLVRSQKSMKLVVTQKVLAVTTDMINQNRWISEVSDGLFTFGVLLRPNQCLASTHALETKLLIAYEMTLLAPSEPIHLGRQFKERWFKGLNAFFFWLPTQIKIW